MRMRRRWIAVLAGLALTGAVAIPAAQAQTPAPSTTQPATSQPAQAQPEKPAEPAGPNTGLVSLSLGTDWASAYYFRGIATLQNGGNNVQPYAEIGFKLLENLGPLTSLTLSPGIWNNWHSGGGKLVDPTDPKFWTEADLYIKLSTTWWEVFTASLTYTYYASPNDTFVSYSDLGLAFSLNDSKWLGAFALNPSLLFAFETHGEALVADDKKGIYMGIGLAPGYTFFAESQFPLTVSAPMTFGFSVKDYYTVNGDNQTFGYFSGGPQLSMPLKFIPAKWGSWSFKGGVQFLVLNGNLKEVNTNDAFVPIGYVGFSMTY